MTKIKLCGLKKLSDVECANSLFPDYVGFVFYPESKRYITKEEAVSLKKALDPGIMAVGVFVDERPERIADLLNEGIIDIAQLHGSEDESCIEELKKLSDKPVIRAFRIVSEADVKEAVGSKADHVLLDSGAGTGSVFDWSLLKGIERPYFLAGGLSAGNVEEAIDKLHPFAVDVSSGIETDGAKDPEKMRDFVDRVRRCKG